MPDSTSPNIFVRFFMKRWLRRLVLLCVSCVLAYFAFFLGLEHAFPGETLSRYIERQIANQTGVQTQIDPIRLYGLQSIRVPHMALIAPPSLPISKLFVVNDFQINVLPNVFNRSLGARADIYGGKVLATWKFEDPDKLGVAIENVEVGFIPAVNLNEFVNVRGKVTRMFASIQNLRGLATQEEQLPIGIILGKIEGVQLSLKDVEGSPLAGMELPPLQFPEVVVEADYGESIVIRKIQLTGALEGIVEGQIDLNLSDVLASKARFHAKLRMSEELQEAVEKNPVIKSILQQMVLCGDVIDAEFAGMLRLWNTPQKKCS